MPVKRRIAIAIEIDQPQPHHQGVFSGVQQFASEHPHWECFIEEYPGYDSHRRKHASQYDGVIARATVPVQNRLKRLGIPLVNVHFQSHRPGVAGVYIDPQQLGRIVAEHLTSRGFKRIYSLFYPHYKHSSQISAAIEQYADADNVRYEGIHIDEGVYGRAADWVNLEKLVEQCFRTFAPPAAIHVEHASVARLIVQYAQSHGMKVPQDLAVLCGQDIQAIVDVGPKISSIDSNYERVGYEAASLLERLMAGEPVPDEPVWLDPRGVIGRESTDYFAVNDELVAEALRYISTRLDEKLRVDAIAYALNVSPRLLQKRFSVALRRGVSDEIRRLRLEKAKRLLAEPGRPIGSIPCAVGFATADVMNKIFRRELNMTPSEYRKHIGYQGNR